MHARTHAATYEVGAKHVRAHTVGQQMGAGARGLGRIECLVVTWLPAPGLDRSSCGDAGRRLRLLLLRLLRGWLHGLLHLHLPAHRRCRRKRLRYDRRRHHRQVQRLGRLSRLLLFLLQARNSYAGRRTVSEGLFCRPVLRRIRTTSIGTPWGRSAVPAWRRAKPRGPMRCAAGGRTLFSQSTSSGGSESGSLSRCFANLRNTDYQAGHQRLKQCNNSMGQSRQAVSCKRALWLVSAACQSRLESCSGDAPI